MFKVLWQEKLAAAGMFLFLAAGILIRMTMGLYYGALIRETENMAATKNTFLKQCKMKYANCYRMNKGVHNVPVFVDKCMTHMSAGAVSLDTLYQLTGQMMLLSVVCSGVGVCRSILHGASALSLLPFYGISGLGLYLFFTVTSMADVRGKKRMLKIHLVDYLENHMSTRMEVTQKDIEKVYAQTPGKPVSSGSRGKTGPAMSPGIKGKTGDTASELEALLQDFLTS